MTRKPNKSIIFLLWVVSPEGKIPTNFAVGELFFTFKKLKITTFLATVLTIKNEGVTMKYDDIILQCCGDCEICAVYLECQYQTSSDDEKQKYLQLLVERDENLSTIANNDNNTELVTENFSETVDSEVFDQENNTEVTDQKNNVEVTETTATDTPDGESNDNDNEQQSQSEEFQSDVESFNEVITQKEVLTPPDAQTVRNIYNEVFGIKALTTELVEAEANETTESSEEIKTVEAAETLQQPETKAVERKTNDDVTPITEETIKKIYNEVFGLTLQTVEQSVDNDDKNETNEREVLEEADTKQEEIQNQQEVLEQPSTTTATEEGQEQQEQQEQQEESVKEKATFKLTPPENNEELLANMCAKRGRKLIYKPNEPILTASFKVLGTDKKNDIGEKIKDILDAEIKQGVKVGYLDKFDGLSSAEIKEEYENDIVYEFAEQEFKKTGVIYDGSKIKVYVYDWDGKACHHVGYVDVNEAKDFIPYFTDKENYSFDVCGIITGGKGKRVVKEGSSVKIVKEKGEPIGIDVDIVVLNRKD